MRSFVLLLALSLLAGCRHQFDSVSHMMTAEEHAKYQVAQRELLTAVKAGDMNEVQALVEHGVRADGDFVQAFHEVFASQSIPLPMMELLIDKARLAVSSPAYQTLLHIATERADVEMVKLLLQKGAWVNAVRDTPNQETPLDLAVLSKDRLYVGYALLMAGGAYSGMSSLETLIFEQSAQGRILPQFQQSESEKSQQLQQAVRLWGNVNKYSDDAKTPLLMAAEYNNAFAVSALVKSGAMVELAAPGNLSPLYVAASYGSWDAVRALLNAGANPNSLTLENETPLFAAARSGELRTIKAILARNTNPNHVSSTGHTPLSAAAEKENVNALTFLVEAGGNIHYATDAGSEAIEQAMAKNARVHAALSVWRATRDPHAVVHCLENMPTWARQAVVSYEQSIAAELFQAIRKGNSRAVQAFLTEHSELLNSIGGTESVDSRQFMDSGKGSKNQESVRAYKTPLYQAIESNQPKIVQQLLQVPVSVYLGIFVESICNDNSPCLVSLNSPLMLAAEKGNLAIVKTLVSAGADVRVDASKLMYAAAASGNVALAKYLQNEGLEVSSGALTTAVCRKQTAMVNYLLSAGVSVNEPNRELVYPIHAAADCAGLPMVKLIASKGGNVNTVSGDGRTPLHFAALNGDLATAKFLVAQGARINAIDRGGYTPFDSAKHHADVAAFLYSNGGVSGRSLINWDEIPVEDRWEVSE